MRPIFRAELVNRTFGDPGIYIDLKFSRRALLFDIGDVTELSTRKLLRISDVFVSHTHMDHFAGFDHLLRVCLGRDAGVRMYGPPCFIDQLGHKLAAYTWNLVENYTTDFVVTAHELDDAGRVQRAAFRSKRRFEREPLEDARACDGVLLEDQQFRVRARALDHHGIASLAFSFEEGMHINVWKNRLTELGLPTGPWLTDLKRKVREGVPDSTPITVRWRTRDGSREETFDLGELKRKVLDFTPGQRVCYVTDVAGHEQNTRSLIAFLAGADVLFIEAVFLDEDRELAARRAHLTARHAGFIARAAGAKMAIPFHFSPRYLNREDELRREFEASWRADQDSPTHRNSDPTQEMR
jgi:ribonuclease Z